MACKRYDPLEDSMTNCFLILIWEVVLGLAFLSLISLADSITRLLELSPAASDSVLIRYFTFVHAQQTPIIPFERGRSMAVIHLDGYHLPRKRV